MIGFNFVECFLGFHMSWLTLFSISNKFWNSCDNNMARLLRRPPKSPLPSQSQSVLLPLSWSLIAFSFC